MYARNVKSVADAKAIIKERGLEYVKVGVFDIDGIMRGKYMGKDKFLSALDKGFGFCDVVLGWDSYDQLYDNVQITGWHTGYPDADVHILPEVDEGAKGCHYGRILLKFTGQLLRHKLCIVKSAL